MKKYEIVVILSGKLKDNELKSTISDLKNLFKKFGGQVTAESIWGLIKLSYPINKEGRGNYILWRVSFEPNQINPLQNELRVADKLLRFLIVEEPKFETRIDIPIFDTRKSLQATKKSFTAKQKLAGSTTSSEKNTKAGAPTVTESTSANKNIKSDTQSQKTAKKGSSSDNFGKKLDEILEEKI